MEAFTSKLSNGPSSVAPVPAEFKPMILPKWLQQKPSSGLYRAAKKAALEGPEAQIAQARAGLRIFNAIIGSVGLNINLNIKLDPDGAAIVDKLNKDATYWLRTTDITRRQLLEIISWLQGKIEAGREKNPSAFYLIIDYQNFYGCLRDIIGPGYDTHVFMSEVADILCYIIKKKSREERKPIGIILCMHNHNLRPSSGFYDLIRILNSCIAYTGYRGAIIVIPTHNRSSFDDLILFIAAQVVYNIQLHTLFREQYNILTSDGLRDMKGNIATHLIHTQGINEYLMSYYDLLSPSEINRDTARQIIDEIKINHNYVMIGRRPDLSRESSPLPRGVSYYPPALPLSHSSDSRSGALSRGASYRSASSHRPPPHGSGRRHSGGTIKYKKSLATKRSRKVYKKKYSQKVTSVHKKYKKHKTIKRKKRL